MNVKLHGFFQALLTFGQFANVATGAFPKAEPVITLVFTLAQVGLAFTAHYSNPDGTSAKAPYVKE